ncbi:MAG: sarcosine oxidase subunit gamma [Halioglobus sp.]|jgi:sarcosine oxidase subunit gamma
MSSSMPSQEGELDARVRRESPLHYVVDEVTAVVVGQRSAETGVVIREFPDKGYLNLRGNPEDEGFRRGVAEVLGVELPLEPSSFATNGDNSVYWLGPDEWMVIVAGGSEVNIEGGFRQSLTGHFSVVDVSGGFISLRLSGEMVSMVLKKSSVYDFDPSGFRVGRCVQTTFAKASALVFKNADGSFGLVFRRSFSDYLYRWIIDAADEYGIASEG